MVTIQEIGETLEKLLGKHEWTPLKPFVITALNTRDNTSYRFEISRTGNALCMLEIMGDNWLRSHYLLSKEAERWKLADEGRKKWLLEAYELVYMAIEPFVKNP